MTFAPDFTDRRARRRHRRTTTTRKRAIDILLLHYTGMQVRRGRARAPVRSGRESLVALSRLRGRPHRSARAGSAARLARGRVVVEGRDRHQLALDRHRDRQSGPRVRLPRLSRRADRGRDRALPRHPGAPRHSAAARARRTPTSRPRASRTRARNFPGRASPPPASAAGSSPSPIGADTALEPGDRGAQVADLQRALARFGYAADVTHLYDQTTAEIVTAFQRHFRPARVDGLADDSTVATLQRLLTSVVRTIA